MGELNGISISGDEVQRAIMNRARQFPGQEQRVFQYYTNNPQAQAEIRAPLFEDKVVDFIAELAQITDRKVDRVTLFSDPDDAVQSDKSARAEKSRPQPYIKPRAVYAAALKANRKGAWNGQSDGIL